MPELPEVETIRRQLEPELVGRRIVEAAVLDPRWSRPEPPSSIEEGVRGRGIESVARRGKYLLVALDDTSTLVMHLRMTGNLLLAEREEPPSGAKRPPFGRFSPLDPRERRLGMDRLYPAATTPAHLRAELELDDGRLLRFTDPRRFGHASLLSAGELEPYFEGRLGVEPLSDELTPELIGQIAAGRTVPLKSFLLDQRGIAGIGNIYA
ncbi:MAG: DNA-formamidopyrimidine glycosylase family protein, partial [Solirubrobacterales bacterium]